MQMKLKFKNYFNRKMFVKFSDRFFSFHYIELSIIKRTVTASYFVIKYKEIFNIGKVYNLIKKMRSFVGKYITIFECYVSSSDSS